MPDTITVWLRFSPRFSMAWATSRMMMPLPQPGHQIWGRCSGRMYL